MGYEFCQSTLHKNKITDYLVIEIDAVVNFMQSDNVHALVVTYENSLDIIDKGFDIFYANSAVQYVYDDTFFLKLLMSVSLTEC